MLNFSSIMLGTHDSKKLAIFYEKVLGKKPDWEDGDWYSFKIGSTYLTIGPRSEVSDKAQEPERLIINLETKEVEEEFKRIKELGAQVIKEPYNPGEAEEMKIATFADPDGNYFQLMEPWEGE